MMICMSPLWIFFLVLSYVASISAAGYVGYRIALYRFNKELTEVLDEFGY